MKSVVENQKGRLDAATTRMTKFRNPCGWSFSDEVNAPTASSCKNLLHVQKSLVATLEKEMANPGRFVALINDWDAIANRYEDTSFSVKQRLDFVKKEMARLEAELLKLVQKRDASVANAEKLFLAV